MNLGIKTRSVKAGADVTTLCLIDLVQKPDITVASAPTVAGADVTIFCLIYILYLVQKPDITVASAPTVAGSVCM